jgi:hypothetical protein
MKELKQSIVFLPRNKKPEKIIAAIESEVKKYWDIGWAFVNAEPDKLFETVCLYFEREVPVE